MVSLPLLYFSLTRERRRSSFSPGRFLAEIARGAACMCLPHAVLIHGSHPCAHRPRPAGGVGSLTIKHKTPYGVLCGRCAFQSPLCVPFCRNYVLCIISSTQALFTSARFPSTHHFLFLLPGFWERALPAAVFDVLEVRPSRSVLLAARAARGLVTFERLLLAILTFSF